MLQPTNEQGVIYLFAQLAAVNGWQVIEIRSAFPDALYMHRGEEWRVEFEFESDNFRIHNHDHRLCDMIVCWNNNYTECPLPIIALSSDDWKGRQYTKCTSDKAAAEYWRQRAMRAEWTIKRMKIEGKQQPASTEADVPLQKVAIRRGAISRLIEAYGPMGAPELVEKLFNDCNIKASRQTIRDDCTALVEDGRLIQDGRKWDVVRIVADQRPAPVGFSTNGNH
jgi:hypothetical protein